MVHTGEVPPGGSRTRPFREIHLSVEPGATEDLRFNARVKEDPRGDSESYSIEFDLEWSHQLPFPDAIVFHHLHRQIVKNAKELEALRLASRSTGPGQRQ